MSLPILHLSRLAWPADWTRLFGRDAPLLLELGFGGGDYLTMLAGEHPEANVLGIEISLPSLRRGVRKVEAAGLHNVRILQADSRSALWLLFRPGSVYGVTINFPDPWPKAHHHHRRLLRAHFLRLLATRMVSEAPLDIATDHAAYAAAIKELLQQSPYFESRLAQPMVLDEAFRRQTKYEKTALTEGRTPRYFPWRRNQRVAPNEFPIPEEAIVPHVVLLSALDLDEIGARFEPFHAQEEDVHVQFLRAYRALDAEGLLVEAYVSEEPYHQRIGLSIRKRQKGDLVVSVQEIGFPRPTPGIHLAVGRLLAWLQEIDPRLQIINSTLKDSPILPGSERPPA